MTRTRTTHTYVILDVEPATFEDCKKRIIAAFDNRKDADHYLDHNDGCGEDLIVFGTVALRIDRNFEAAQRERIAYLEAEHKRMEKVRDELYYGKQERVKNAKCKYCNDTGIYQSGDMDFGDMIEETCICKRQNCKRP